MKYAAWRVAQAVPLLLLISVAAFAVIHLAPGGPATVYVRGPTTANVPVTAIRAAFGLTDPLPLQYLKWLRSLLEGNWGYSFVDGRPVLTVIGERVPATLLLMTAAPGFAFVLALPAGIVAALRHRSWLDHLMGVASFFAWAMPVFWLGLVAQQVLAVDLGLFPVAGMQSTDAFGLPDLLHHLVLPAVVLGLASVAGWSRYLRTSLLEVLSQPYVTTARAKGGSPARTVVRHALPNALLPLVAVMGLDVPRLFAGAVVTETVFAWPGMGRLFFDSLSSRDYPVEMGLLMVTAALIVAGNLAADLVSAALDPRIRLGASIR